MLVFIVNRATLGHEFYEIARFYQGLTKAVYKRKVENGGFCWVIGIIRVLKATVRFW